MNRNTDSTFKSKGGVRRIFNAFGYSLSGLKAAFKYESAFRQELLLCMVLVPIAYFLGENILERTLLWCSLLLLLIVELINSSIEALADTVTLEHHPLIKRTKDIASAAVLMTMAAIALLWLGIFYSHL